MSSSFAFPRSEHLGSSKEIRTVLDFGNSVHGTQIVLFVYHEPALPRQVAFVASRRVGNAVRRNRSKRLMREAYRHLCGRYPKMGTQFVLVARRACGDATFSQVINELERMSKQTGLLEDQSSEHNQRHFL